MGKNKLSDGGQQARTFFFPGESRNENDCVVVLTTKSAVRISFLLYKHTKQTLAPDSNCGFSKLDLCETLCYTV